MSKNNTKSPIKNRLARVVSAQQQVSAQQHGPQALQLSALEQKAFGLIPVANVALKQLRQKHATPYVVLKYFDSNYECFSDWTADNLKAFSSFNQKLSQSNWSDIYKSGGSAGNKAGFGYTTLTMATISEKSRARLKAVEEMINPDLTFFELRVTQEARVHGFRCGESFFLVLLDQDHNVYRGK